jgi:MFS transporter, DHA1 family, inner membrane transport protein
VNWRCRLRRRNARLALLLGATGVTIFTAALGATRTDSADAIVTMAALRLAVGLTIVPQQHRLFATVPALAPVTVGLNGSAIYIGSARGAGIGGVALAIGGRAAPTITAAIIGVLAVTIAAAIVPEQMTARKPANTTSHRPDRKQWPVPAVSSRGTTTPGRLRVGRRPGAGSDRGTHA